MSDPKDEELFLSRWSRRKVEARRADSGEGPVDPPEASSVPAASAPATPSGPDASPQQTQAPLPMIEDLFGLKSEYRDFLRPGVDDTLRRSALKKLFQDPHFNVMDGLDTYIDDYSKEDPIPAAMLRALNQAQGLIFDREDEHGAASPTDPTREPAQEQVLEQAESQEQNQKQALEQAQEQNQEQEQDQEQALAPASVPASPSPDGDETLDGVTQSGPSKSGA